MHLVIPTEGVNSRCTSSVVVAFSRHLCDTPASNLERIVYRTPYILVLPPCDRAESAGPVDCQRRSVAAHDDVFTGERELDPHMDGPAVMSMPMWCLDEDATTLEPWMHGGEPIDMRTNVPVDHWR